MSSNMTAFVNGTSPVGVPVGTDEDDVAYIYVRNVIGGFVIALWLLYTVHYYDQLAELEAREIILKTSKIASSENIRRLSTRALSSNAAMEGLTNIPGKKEDRLAKPFPRLQFQLNACTCCNAGYF